MGELLQSGVNTINNAVTLNGVAHFIIGNHNMVYTKRNQRPRRLCGRLLWQRDSAFSGQHLQRANHYRSSGNNPEVALTGTGSISQSSLIFFWRQ